MKFLTFLILLPVFMFIFSNCNEKKKNSHYSFTDTINIKNTLQYANKKLVKTEEEQINDIINRYGWKMEETGTGLKYMIYKKTKGNKPKKGEIAIINYVVKLITGDLCYSSKEDGPLEILIGKNTEISGLEEAVLLLHEGEKAKLIVHSHLAYGLLGNEKKIPKRATLIYDIELIKIK